MAAALGAGCALLPGAGSAAAVKQAQLGLSLPVAGTLVQARVVARARPTADGRVLATFQPFRPDYRPTVLFAFGAKRVAGSWWLHVEIPGRPNGRTGWVRRGGVAWSSRPKRIVIDLSARTLELDQGSHVLVRSRVAVGRPGMETPTGSYYIVAGYQPQESVLGVYAFETSAYSKLSDWPGGGIVGIHGWNDPSVFGQAVSHGCVRVPNDVALKLRDLVPTGTPVTIRA